MPHPGPGRGAQPRTLREIALHKGTTPSGFDGVAVPEDDYAGQYFDRATAALPTGSGAKEADPQPVPFVLRGSGS